MSAKPPKTRNHFTITECAFNGMIKSMLRAKSMQWKPAQEAIKRAECGTIINPDTGRTNKAYQCAECLFCFMKKDVKADHIEPVVPLTGFTNWDDYINRMYCEVDGFQCLCDECHDEKTEEENYWRRRLCE